MSDREGGQKKEGGRATTDRLCNKAAQIKIFVQDIIPTCR